MTEIELRNKATSWLYVQSTILKTRPQRFRPKEVAEAVGGAYGSMGKVADDVVSELQGRGIKIRYVRQSNTRFFELF